MRDLSSRQESADCLVIGAGPVGLLCALALARAGRSVTVLERSAEPRRETRSIGIHAASLAGLDRLGLADELLARGVRIVRGVAVGSRGVLGVLDFADEPLGFGCALAIAQPQTEALLEAAALRAGVRLVRGAELIELVVRRGRVEAGYAQAGEPRRLTARLLLGCDGAHGRVRALAGIGLRRRRLPGCYWMAELPATPALGDDAYIFLADTGLVESFPLPGGHRRWVVEVERRAECVDLQRLRALIALRTGHLPTLPSSASDARASAFGPVQALAHEFRRGPILLLGDAAHVLSPFGGLGMNLGWLDALALAEEVASGWTAAGLDELALQRWAARRRRAARVALRQAAINSRLGHRCAAPRLRNAVVWLALRGPWARAVVGRVAMAKLVSPPAT